MTDRRDTSPAFRRWPAVMGALLLWLGALAAVPVAPAAAPRPVPIVFRFQPDSDAISAMLSGDADSIANFWTLEQLLVVLPRLAAASVEPVWVGHGPLFERRLGSLLRRITGSVLGRELSVPVPNQRVRRAAAQAAEGAIDQIELRLKPTLVRSDHGCSSWLEIIDPTLPPALADAVAPVTLTLIDGRYRIGAGTLWRRVTAGNAGHPGPWLPVVGPLQVAASEAGLSKEFADFLPPWSGTGQASVRLACHVELVPVGG